MNRIKGLITKDLLQLKSYRKTLIIFIVVFTMASVTQENKEATSIMFSTLIPLVFGMFAIASFSYDELSKSDRFVLTLPVSKKEVVFSKYVLVVLFTIIGAIIGLVVSIISMIILNQTIDVLQIINISLLELLVISFIESFQIPCIYKWGPEKGRIQVFVIIVAFSLLSGGVTYLIQNLNINFELNNIINTIFKFLPIIIIAMIGIVYYISYRISYKVYLKKEI